MALGRELAEAGRFPVRRPLLMLVMPELRVGYAAPRVRVSAEVWDDARVEGLEWSVPSPAPYHTFDEAPVVK